MHPLIHRGGLTCSCLPAASASGILVAVIVQAAAIGSQAFAQQRSTERSSQDEAASEDESSFLPVEPTLRFRGDPEEPPSSEAAASSTPPSDRTSAATEPGEAIDPAGSYLAERADTELTVDGALSESSWAEVSRHSRFYLRRSDPPWQDPPPEHQTEVSFVYNDHALYIGVWANQPPSEIQTTLSPYNDFFRKTDYICALIDRSGRGETALSFCVSPAGELYDEKITNRGATFLPWNGTWWAEAARTETGWTAEFEIPWRTLGYGTTEGELPLRAIIERRVNNPIPEKQMSVRHGGGNYYHVPASLPIRRVSDIEPEIGIEITPNLLTTFEGNDFVYPRWADLTGNSDDFRVKAGIDFSMPVGNHSRLSVTFNPDFLETPADAFQANLSRFPIFFPDQRRFFNESDEVFQFGEQGRTQLFYSRNIGLTPKPRDSTEPVDEVPLLGGVRLITETDGIDVGALVVQGNRSVRDDLSEIPEINFSAARIRGRPHEDVSIGGVFTQRLQVAGDGSLSERTYGIDGQLQAWDGRFTLSGFAALSEGEDIGFSGHGRAVFASDPFVADFAYTYSGRNFFPSLGLYRTLESQDIHGQATVFHRGVEWLQYAAIGVGMDIVSDLDGDLIAQDASVLVEARTPSEAVWNLSLHALDENFSAPFEPLENVVYPSGSYDYRYLRTSVTSPASFPLVGFLEYTQGGFLSGSQQRVSASLTLNVDPVFTTVAYSFSGLSGPSEDTNQNDVLDLNEDLDGDGILDSGRTQEHIVRGQLSLVPDARLQINLSVQYAAIRDLLQPQLVASWQFARRSFLYLIGIQRSEIGGIFGANAERLLSLKFTYQWSL